MYGYTSPYDPQHAMTTRRDMNQLSR
jgi:hypothetical protein